MPLSNDRIPNNPLTGVELKERVLYVLRELFERMLPPPIDKGFVPIPLALLRTEMDNDYVFGATLIYPNCSWSAVAKFHFTAPDVKPMAVLYSLEANFVFRNITMPKHKVSVRSAPPPLPTSAVERQETGVLSFSVEEKIESPNIVRVNTGLPITIVRAIRPEPGEFIGKIERHDIQYDKTDYPEPPEPVVVDISAECRREWGVPEPKVSEPVEVAVIADKAEAPAHGSKERRQAVGKYSVKDKADLDAIGQEE